MGSLTQVLLPTKTSDLIQSASTDTESAVCQYGLSKRGAHNMVYRDIWGPRSKQMLNPWTPKNPQGSINLRLAENNMLHTEVESFIHKQLHVEGVHHLTYSTGPRGSLRLRNAAARFLEVEFEAINPVTFDDIFVMPGLTSAVDALVWAICNEGDGVIIPRPLYNGFKIDVQHRTGAVVIDADFRDLDEYTDIDDLFDAKMNRKALERAWTKAKARGVTARAVMISNPHNPLGRCYPVETIYEIASFCGENGLHFIVDEIYARSVFHNPNLPDAPTFKSSLSLDLSKSISSELHHVLYGASKDFCANGLRLGFLYTKNKGILGAISSNSPFSWSPHILQDIWAGMLEDEEWRRDFFEKNRVLMQQQYQLATKFLREHGINYYEMNAGVYIWVDLRPYLLPQSTPDSQQAQTFSILQVNSPNSKIFLERENKIIEVCAKNGVMIAPGSSYLAEEYGWFRVTFTTPTAPLVEGLTRIWRGLEEVRRLW